MVDIIDVGMGNVHSIRNNLSRLGVSCRIIDNPNALASPIIILPGVGSALPFMNNIRAKNFDKAIQKHIIKGNRIIGICLGFQVMTEFSEEDGGVACLGLIKTETIPLERHYPSSNHNQWEKFSLRKEDLSLSKTQISILNSRKRVINGRVFYNHEYGVKIPNNKKYFKSINSTNLASYASLYCKDNIVGIQFHPEKSQFTGLDILSFFL